MGVIGKEDLFDELRQLEEEGSCEQYELQEIQIYGNHPEEGCVYCGQVIPNDHDR